MSTSQFKRNGKENVIQNRENLLSKKRKRISPKCSTIEYDNIDSTLSSDEECTNITTKRRMKTQKKSSMMRSSKFLSNEDLIDLKISSDGESSSSSFDEKLIELMQASQKRRNVNIQKDLKAPEAFTADQIKISKVCEQNLQAMSKSQKPKENVDCSDSFDSMIKFLLTPPSDDGSAENSSKTDNTEQADITFEEIMNMLLTPDLSPVSKSSAATQKTQPKVQITADSGNKSIRLQKSLQKNLNSTISNNDQNRVVRSHQPVIKSKPEIGSDSVSVLELTDQYNNGQKSQELVNTFINKVESKPRTLISREKKNVNKSIVTSSQCHSNEEVTFKQELAKELNLNLASKGVRSSGLVRMNVLKEQNSMESTSRLDTDAVTEKIGTSNASTFLMKKLQSSKNNESVKSGKIVLENCSLDGKDVRHQRTRRKIEVNTGASKSELDKQVRFNPKVNINEVNNSYSDYVIGLTQESNLSLHSTLRERKIIGTTVVNNLRDSSCLKIKGTKQLNSDNFSEFNSQSNIEKSSQSTYILCKNKSSKDLKNDSLGVKWSYDNDNVNSGTSFDNFSPKVVTILPTIKNSQLKHYSKRSQNSKEIGTQTSFDDSPISHTKINTTSENHCAISAHKHLQLIEIESSCSTHSDLNSVPGRDRPDHISSNSSSTSLIKEENKKTLEPCLEIPFPKSRHILNILSEDVTVLPDQRKLFNNIGKIGTDKWLRFALNAASENETKVCKKQKMIDILETGNTIAIYIDYSTQIHLKRSTNRETAVYQITKTKETRKKCHIPSELSHNRGVTRSTRNASKLELAINEIGRNPSFLSSDNDIQEIDKSKIQIKIHAVFARLYEVFEDNNIPNLKYGRQATIKDCVFENERLQRGTFSKKCNISYKQLRTLFCRILYVLGKIYVLLQTNQKLTKREIFYQVKHVIGRQHLLDKAIDEVSRLLGVGPWSLNIITHSGLVYGNIKLVWASGEMTDCNLPATLIPFDLENLVEVRSTASFILVVEKESIFHKLLEEDLPNKLARPFIMITGKGVPDNNTRLFLNRMSRIMKVPVFIMADADIYGIRIMLTYRFGSISNCHLSDDLTVPHARWIGVYPSEIRKYGMNHQAISKRDKTQINAVLNYPYLEHYPKITTELEFLLAHKKKASIEGLLKSSTFLSDSYLPMKFLNRDFI